MHPDKIKKPVYMLALLVAVVSIYFGSIDNPFVYDDRVIIAENVNLNDIGNLKKLFNHDYFNISGERSYRPVATALFFIQTLVGGKNPPAFHITSILLHAANAILLFLILSSFANARATAFLASLIFALHPIQSEAVNAASFVEDPLAAFFLLAALFAHIGAKRESGGFSIPRLALASLFYLFAMFSKENAAVFPAVVLVYEWVSRRKSGFNEIWQSRTAYFCYITVFVIFALIRFVLMANSESGALPVYPAGSFVESAPLILSAFLKYLQMFFFSSGFSLVHCVSNPDTLMTIKPILAMLFYALIFIAGLAFVKSEKYLSFGAFFFLINMIPISNIAPIGEVIAERYFYMPSMGLSIMLAGAFMNSGLKLESAKPKIMMLSFLIGLCVAFFFGAKTIERNRDWRDELYLWKSAVDVCPDSSKARTGYGRRLVEIGATPSNLKEAITNLEAAVRLDPRHYEAYLALGTAYWRAGRHDEALKTYYSAYAFHPTNDVRYNIALLLNSLGRPAQAKPMIEEILITQPDWNAAVYLMGNTLLYLGDIEGARRRYEHVLESEPSHANALGMSGVTYLQAGDFDTAISFFRKVLQIDPNNQAASANLEHAIRMKDALKKNRRQ
ncbi:MAG TPA: tetratricopeptide repeat protein [bacterium]|nr:tetratricopeptide repeat protein [bacterium]